MKELSVEEKAKRYDEALKAAIVASKDEDMRLKATLERIFPELKESEDERTWIINYLSNRILNSTIIAEKENLKKAIAWLEKQGEQKPAWSKEDEEIIINIGEYLNRYGNYIVESNEEKAADVYKSADWLKSLKERYTWKPSELQIEALVSAIDVMIDNKGAGDKNTILLSGLYHELKAL